MIPLLWLAGAAVVGVMGGVAIAVYWKKIIAWIEKVYEKLPSSIQQELQGAMAFLRKIDEIYTNVMKYYSYSEKTEEWTETTVSSTVKDPNEIPQKFRDLVKHKKEIDISDDLQEQLKLVNG